MSSKQSGRVLVAATLAAALFLAVPVEAIDGRDISQGPLERLVAWFVETWVSDGLAGGTDPGTLDDAHSGGGSTPPAEDDDDPEGCRGEYTGCVDPNG